MKRIDAMNKTFQSFVSHITTSKWILAEGKWNLTEFVHLFTYGEWVDSQRAKIKEEIKSAYEQSMAAGYIWEQGIIQDAQSSFDRLADGIAQLCELIRGMLTKSISNESERKLAFDAMKKRQSSCYVDEASCKVRDTNDQRLVLVPPS